MLCELEIRLLMADATNYTGCLPRSIRVIEHILNGIASAVSALVSK